MIITSKLTLAKLIVNVNCVTCPRSLSFVAVSIAYEFLLSGDMLIQNLHSGYSGYTINGIKQIAIPAYKQKPNVVLIHAGTNDMDSSNPQDLADAPRNLGALIQAIIDNCPDILVLVAQIVPRKDPAKDKITQDFNNAIPEVVKAFTDHNHHVMVVDMHKAVSVTDLSPDGKHPNAGGYQKMADAWHDALDQASDKGWIKSATAQDRLGTCDIQPTWTAQHEEIFHEYNPGQNLWPGTICKDEYVSSFLSLNSLDADRLHPAQKMQRSVLAPTALALSLAPNLSRVPPLHVATCPSPPPPPSASPTSTVTAA